VGKAAIGWHARRYRSLHACMQTRLTDSNRRDSLATVAMERSSLRTSESLVTSAHRPFTMWEPDDGYNIPHVWRTDYLPGLRADRWRTKSLTRDCGLGTDCLTQNDRSRQIEEKGPRYKLRSSTFSLFHLRTSSTTMTMID
jgi:hypothetical protein